jgi:hypothetical protein
VRYQASLPAALHDHLGEAFLFHQGIVVAGHGVVNANVNQETWASVGNAVRPDGRDVGERAGLPGFGPEFPVQGIQQEVTTSLHTDIHLRLVIPLVLVALVM